MLYLLLNVIFASAFSLIIKWVQVRKQEDVVTVGAINYIVAAAWIAPHFLRSNFVGDTATAAWTGGIMGTCYFVAYFFVILAIRWIGVASATVISALSILVPVTFGILLWGERPSQYQTVGVFLAAISLYLITARQKRPSVPEEGPQIKSWIRAATLVCFFILAGSSRLTQEAFKHESRPEHYSVFLVTAFVVASVPSILLLVFRRKRISLTEFGLGFAMGSANILQTQFILHALEDFDGYIVFPASSVGGLLLTTLVAGGLLGEQFNRRRMTGIAIAAGALVLLNW